MFEKKSVYIFGLLALALLLSACGAPATLAAPTQPAPTTVPTAVPTAAPIAIPTSVPTAVPTAAPQGPTLDVNGVAASFTSQIVAAVPGSANGPYWDTMPQHTLIDLAGYPVSGSLMKPQIFIYSADELAGSNEAAGKVAADLQALLQSQQTPQSTVGKGLPYLPIYNAAQAMHAQVKYLDFKNGKGVRYLTQFDQAPLQISNHELLYTFQGLTSDGKYYVAAVLPVNLPGLPASEIWSDQTPPVSGSDYLKYVDGVVANLNGQSGSAFTPDLGKLDAMVQSIEIR